MNRKKYIFIMYTATLNFISLSCAKLFSFCFRKHLQSFVSHIMSSIVSN